VTNKSIRARTRVHDVFRQISRDLPEACEQDDGTAATTWSHGHDVQANPVYCGCRRLFLEQLGYIRSSGLGSHVMAVDLNAQHTTAFPNYPTNEHVLTKFRATRRTATKTAKHGGAIGYSWMVWRCSQLGCVTYNSTSGTEAQNTTGYWTAMLL